MLFIKRYRKMYKREFSINDCDMRWDYVEGFDFAMFAQSDKLTKVILRHGMIKFL